MNKVSCTDLFHADLVCERYRRPRNLVPGFVEMCALERVRVFVRLFLCFQVGWCFKPSQPQRIISGLREIFVERYRVERTNKAEISPKEQSENAELVS